MFNDYLLECENNSMKKYSYSKYASMITLLSLSFAELGIEECKVCEEHKVHLKASENFFSGHGSSRETKLHAKKLPTHARE